MTPGVRPAFAPATIDEPTASTPSIAAPQAPAPPPRAPSRQQPHPLNRVRASLSLLALSMLIGAAIALLAGIAIVLIALAVRSAG